MTLDEWLKTATPEDKRKLQDDVKQWLAGIEKGIQAVRAISSIKPEAKS